MARKITIIGSGPAGLTAAVYAARANLEPLVIEGWEAGGQLMITTEVENYPGFPEGITGPELIDVMRKQAERFNTEFMAGDVVKAELGVHPFRLHTDSEDVIETHTVVIATGATAKYLGLDSERPWPEGLGNRGVSACAVCDGAFFKDKHVFVVGGGDTAMEESIYLTRMCSQVSVVHRRDELRASKIMQQRALDNSKIDWRWSTVVDEILGLEEGQVTGVRLRSTKEEDKVWDEPAEGLFLAIGHKPNTDPFADQLDTDELGYLVVKPGTTGTNISGVFASGDVADRTYRQAVTAAGLGCMGALEAERWLEEQGLG